jgi:hypothetical protein
LTAKEAAMIRLYRRWKNRHRHEWVYGMTLMGYRYAECRTCGKFDIIV